MREWQELLDSVLTFGDQRPDRTGIGTLSLFGKTIEFDLTDGFPIVTTKKLYIQQGLAELAAFLKGATTKEAFNAEGCTYWDKNIDAWSKTGYAGRIYGAQWRNWKSIVGAWPASIHEVDQIDELIKGINLNPYGRRHMVTAWNPGELEDMCLPPCHCFFQCYVDSTKQYLDMIVYMRSVDLFLGLPFDIVIYAVLQYLIARDTKLKPRMLKFLLGDSHIYLNHIEQVKTVLSRIPYDLPTLKLAPEASVNNFGRRMVLLEGYECHDYIEAALNV